MSELTLTGTADFTYGTLNLYTIPDSDLQVGQEINGRIDIATDSVCLIRGIWIKLEGINKLKLSDQKECTETIMMVDEVFAGFGEGDEDGGNLLEMGQGAYSWEFTFNLPRNCPLSYCDEFGEVTYTLTAAFDCPLIPITMGSVSRNIIVSRISRSDARRLITGNPNLLGVNEKVLSTRNSRGNKRKTKPLRSLTNYLTGSSDNNYLTLNSKSGAAVYPFITRSYKLSMDCGLHGFNFDYHKQVQLNIVLYVLITSVKGKQVFKHVLWNDHKLINTQQQTCAEIVIPIQIQADRRLKMLRKWPTPTPLDHSRYSDINYFTSSSPLFSYRVLYEITAHRKHQFVSAKIGPQNKGARSSSLTPRLLPTLLAGPLEGEVFVTPPTPSSSKPSSSSGSTAVTATAEASISDSGSASSSNPVYGSNSTSSRPGVGIGELGLPPLPARRSSFSASGNTSTLQYSITPRPVESPRTDSTPCAKHIATSVNGNFIKVEAELLSKGPAAILFDRGSNRENLVQCSPNRFTHMYRVSEAVVVVPGSPVNSVPTPQVKPVRTSSGANVRSSSNPASSNNNSHNSSHQPQPPVQPPRSSSSSNPPVPASRAGRVAVRSGSFHRASAVTSASSSTFTAVSAPPSSSFSGVVPFVQTPLADSNDGSGGREVPESVSASPLISARQDTEQGIVWSINSSGDVHDDGLEEGDESTVMSMSGSLEENGDLDARAGVAGRREAPSRRRSDGHPFRPANLFGSTLDRPALAV